MKLSKLLAAVNITHVSGTRMTGVDLEPDPDIGSIHYRADQVLPGGLFVAISGLKADGHDYISQAVDRGAAAVIAEKSVSQQVVAAYVKDTRKALSKVSAAFYHHPSQALTTVGITGTNGKTTTAYIIEHMLNQAGIRTGLARSNAKGLTAPWPERAPPFDSPSAPPQRDAAMEFASRAA